MMRIDIKYEAIKHFWKDWPEALKDFKSNPAEREPFFREFKDIYQNINVEYEQFEKITLEL